MQAAIDASAEGEEVWVAAGTYTPAPPGSPRTASFRLKRGVTVRGGFSGAETALAERTLAAGATVLSGDLAGDDGADFQGRDENCFHVVVAFDAEGAGTLEDVTLRGGHADGPGKGPSPDSQDQGSGLDVFNSSPRIVRCRFEENWSKNHGAANDHGIESVYEDCVFSGNRSDTLGAGLYLHHHSHVLAVGCTFEDNVSAQQGAGVYARAQEGALLQDCVFRRNHTLQGAGIYVAPEGALQVVGCRFEQNEAEIGGGGIYSDQAAPVIQDCVFVENLAGVDIIGGGGGGGGSGGAGVWGVGGAPIVEDCVYQRNRASFGAGVYFIEGCAGTVRRCTFTDNAAQEAGGLYVLVSDVLAEDCRFERNSATGGTFSVGGGMSCYFANATARRCVFVDNRAELGGGGVYLEGEFPRLGESTFVGNEAFGNEEGWGGGLMISYFCHGWVENCAFVGNRAHRGGGYFAMAFGDASVANCTLVANVALVGGPAAASEITAPPIRNSIAWANQPPELGGLFDARDCCLEVGVAGAGNLAGDPGFTALPAPGPDGRFGTADDELGDLALRATSACIDAGDNGALLGTTATDLGGNPRFADEPSVSDTGVPAPPVVDLGAYERQPAGP
ncbi:MAG: right-handed parallel beta-helix repeat-containing protein [Planctomycetes bacterium]|nr:right-handed parallel beta-helix repeat-containing protein [Planctomycetota bacterium]